jgi:hypothetical protein
MQKLFSQSIILFLLFSTSANAQWSQLKLPTLEPYSIVKNRYANGIILCNSFQKGFVISKDDGTTFEKFNSNFTPNAYHFENDTIYVGGYYNGAAYTIDFGKTFIDITTDSIKNQGINSIVSYDKNTLLAGTIKNGLYQFNKKTKEWKNIGLKMQEITGIIVKNKSIFANIKYHGLAKSDDFGNTWKDKIVTHNNSPEDVVEYKGDLIYATYGAGIRISKDNGESWGSYDAGLPDGPFIGNSFAVSRDGNYLFLIGYLEGVFLFNSSLNQWQNISKNLPSPNRGEVIAITNEYLYVEGYPNGNLGSVYKSKIEPLLLATNENGIGKNFIQGFPNPASDEVYFNFGLVNQREGEIQYSIFDLTGKSVLQSVVTNSKLIKIDVSSLNKGNYIVKIMSHKKSFYSKFLKI